MVQDEFVSPFILSERGHCCGWSVLVVFHFAAIPSLFCVIISTPRGVLLMDGRRMGMDEALCRRIALSSPNHEQKKEYLDPRWPIRRRDEFCRRFAQF